MFKRPGLSSFLHRMSKNYEICIFGGGDNSEVNEVCERLDPLYNIIQGRFGRECTIYKHGKYYKDLSLLNRPLNEIIYVDFNDESLQTNKENCIIIDKFEGE